MRSWIQKISAAVRGWKIRRQRSRVERLYQRYHRSFLDNIHEAQEQHRLPIATLQIKNRLNEAIGRLQTLDPATKWKLFT